MSPIAVLSARSVGRVIPICRMPREKRTYARTGRNGGAGHARGRHPCRSACRCGGRSARPSVRHALGADDGFGYAALLVWACGFGTPGPVGIEGTGSYGAGVARWLRGRGVQVIEVER